MRRQEEIIWIREQGFSRVISLIPAPPQPAQLRRAGRLLAAPAPAGHRRAGQRTRRRCTGELKHLLGNDEKLLIHREEVGDRICGLVAGYLLWAGLVPDGPQAISVTERIDLAPVGPEGRTLVANADNLRKQRAS